MSAEEAPPAPAKLRVLIVDDDFLFADMLPKLLHKTIASPTLDVVSARSAAEALEHLERGPFDVVVCDYDLRTPKTGMDVLHHASTARPPPFRILITGHAPRELPPGPDGAVQALLEKPMTLREVPPMLTRILSDELGIRFVGPSGLAAG